MGGALKQTSGGAEKEKKLVKLAYLFPKHHLITRCTLGVLGVFGVLGVLSLSFYIFLISSNCVPKLVWDFPRLCGLDTLIKFIIIIIIIISWVYETNKLLLECIVQSISSQNCHFHMLHVFISKPTHLMQKSKVLKVISGD